MFFINLLQSFFCRTIQFKFHDIYEFVRLQNKVDAPFACMIFHFGIKAYEFENDKKHIFVMQLLLAEILRKKGIKLNRSEMETLVDEIAAEMKGEIAE
jgi:hypothetical protein